MEMHHVGPILHIIPFLRNEYSVQCSKRPKSINSFVWDLISMASMYRTCQYLLRLVDTIETLLLLSITRAVRIPSVSCIHISATQPSIPRFGGI